MMGAVGDIADALTVHEDGGDQGDIGKVRASEGRMIRDGDVARLQVQDSSHFPGAEAERAKVDGNVRRVDH